MSKSSKKLYRFLLILLSIVLVFVAFRMIRNSPNKTNEATRYILAMDTVIKLTAYGDNSSLAISLAISRLYELENLLSATYSISDVVRIRNNAGSERTRISVDTYNVIKSALSYSELSGGSFDITIRPLVELWGFGGNNPSVPTYDDICVAMDLVDYTRIRLYNDHTILLGEGMKIDLGAIAKGYAADEIAKIFDEYSLSGGIIDIGGNILTYGSNPKSGDGTFRIGVADPFDAEGSQVLYVDVAGLSLVTSGDYQRFFVEDDISYHHIIDPKTGYPADSGLRSVTILAPSSTDADALSTCVFLLGEEAGMELIESLQGIECILITNDKRIIASSNLSGKMDLLSYDYSLSFR